MTPPVVLLAALEAFLREDLGRVRGPYELYQARIAANLLALLRRERELGGALAALDREFADAHGLDPQAMPGGLAQALRDGRVAESAAVHDFLRRRSLLALAIDNPRYSGLQQAREAWPEIAARLDAQLAAADSRSAE